MKRLIIAAVGLALVVGIMPGPGLSSAAGGNSITSPDTSGDVGQWTSLVLDTDGNPVVAYQDAGNGQLKLLHCNDPNCAGDDESITSPDTSGAGVSLALDAAGNPVVAWDKTVSGSDWASVLHCNDPNCACGDESVSSVGIAGYLSFALDAAGNPVLAFTTDSLTLLHCNDPNCTGDDESISTPTTSGDNLSLALDAAGNPVVSYQSSYPPWGLHVMHCNDPNCADGGESISSLGVLSNARTSLALDATGNPVVSFHKGGSELTVMHCNDPNCVGGDESIISPDTAADFFPWTSLTLDASGNPVVAYYDATNLDLKVLHCNDPNCDGTVNGPETITTPDTADDVGSFPWLALDATGNPVVSYYDATNGDLKVLHCGNPTCAATTAVGGIAELPPLASAPDGSGMGGATYAVLAGAAAGVLAFAVLATLSVRKRSS